MPDNQTAKKPVDSITHYSKVIYTQAQLERCIREAIAREREQCAQLCESYHGGLTQVIAKELRARSTTPLPEEEKA